MFNMALAFLALGEERRALECLHESIAKEPLSPRAWCSLGWLKIRARDFRGGLAARRIGHCIGLSQEDWLYDSGFWVREAEEFVDHHEHLQAILDGSQAPPSDSELCSAFQFAFSTNQVDAGLLLYEKLVGRRATQGEASLDRRTAISAAALVCRATFVPGISAMSVSEARKRAFVLLNGVVDSLTAEVLRGGDLSAVRRWAFQLADHPDLVTAQCQVARLHVDEAVAWGQLWRRVELMANP
jgi:hypothetical protein